MVSAPSPRAESAHRLVVKICGVRDARGARAVAESGADYAGLLFVPGRRRAIEREQARVLLPHLGSAEPVGVFLDAPLATILATAAELGLRTIQLHGREPVEHAAELQAAGLSVIRAGPIGDEADEARLATHAPFVSAFLVDGARPGSGRPVASAVAGGGRLALLARRLGRPVWLAGGLTPCSVAAAVEDSGASGADVASGIERDGEPDPAQIAAFVAAVRALRDTK